MKDYLACVIGMIGPGRHRAKVRNCVCLYWILVEVYHGGLEELKYAETEADSDADICSPLVGFLTYDDISKFCVSGME